MAYICKTSSKNKVMNVYKIKTGLTQGQIDKLNDSLDSSDMTLIETLEDQVLNTDVVEDGLVSSYMICSEKVLDAICSIFYKYEVKFKVQDITKLFLYGQVSVDDVDFQNFLVENLDIDTILDKINEVGIESLSSLDKEILSK
jgi:uncharacterized protein YkvS